MRELENILQGCVAVSQEDPQTITDRDVKLLLNEGASSGFESAAGDQPLSMEELERTAIQRALRMCQGNRTRAASLLGISRDTLYRKLRQYGTAG